MKHSEANLSARSDRRQWFAGTLRCALLGGLTLLCGHLIFKSRRPECCRTITCRQCGVWGTCGLPQAIETRRRDRG